MRRVYMAHGKTYLMEKHHQNSKSLWESQCHAPSERAHIWQQIGLTPEKKISSYHSFIESLAGPNLPARQEATTIMTNHTQKITRPTQD
jgi:hypothetical protein